MFPCNVDYFTRWVEAIPLHKVNEDAVMDFLQDHIMTRFGVPISLVFDNATYFSSIRLTTSAHEKGIKLHYSTNYYPQGNGLAESTNKNLIRILKKTVIENQRSWHSALLNALWAGHPQDFFRCVPIYPCLWERGNSTPQYHVTFFHNSSRIKRIK